MKNPNRKLKTGEVLDKLKDCPSALAKAYIVGSWVWVEFESKPDFKTRSFLLQLGFHWNKQRNAWQHPCGSFRPYNKYHDPRFKYGMRQVAVESETAA